MKIEIREATAADKDAVMNIRGLVFDGEDYLPTYYEYFLSSPICAIIRRANCKYIPYDHRLVNVKIAVIGCKR